MNQKNIIKISGKLPGKTIAVLAGVHGNEKAGVMAMDKAIKEIKISKGELYFIYANPKAIEKNVRYVYKNLNRCFLSNLVGDDYEILRAKEIMKILDKCDAMLDLHASSNKDATPFIVCEQNAYAIANNLNFKIISSGWDAIEPGASDGYMYNRGKIGLCLECGSLRDSEKNKNLAYDSICQFIAYHNMMPAQTKHDSKQQFINVWKIVYKKTNNFKFIKQFADFELLEKGKIFAVDGDIEYIAGDNECIIFPNENTNIGDEVFILGKNSKELSPPSSRKFRTPR